MIISSFIKFLCSLTQSLLFCRTRSLRSCALCLVSCVFIGCTLTTEKLYTPSEAEQKLIEFCEKEGSGAKVITHRTGQTQWIYAPTTVPIFGVKASSGYDHVARKVMPYSLLSLENYFQEDGRIFDFTFDIIKDVLTPEATTYGSTYNDDYTKLRQLIYQGLQETFFNLKDETPVSQDPPAFIVILIADITTGVATKSIINLTDLKQYMTQALPPDEYYMRELSEVIGNKALIGDKTGENVPYEDITWPFFLSEQIKNRIRYKFTQSNFPPQEEPERAIIEMIANTFRYYSYTDFSAVRLHDRRQKRDVVLTQEELKKFEEEVGIGKEDKGRLHVIKFNLPETAPGTIKADDQMNSEEQLIR